MWDKYHINYLQIFGLEGKGVSYFMEFFEVCDQLFSFSFPHSLLTFFIGISYFGSDMECRYDNDMMRLVIKKGQ